MRFQKKITTFDTPEELGKVLLSTPAELLKENRLNLYGVNGGVWVLQEAYSGEENPPKVQYYHLSRKGVNSAQPGQFLVNREERTVLFSGKEYLEVFPMEHRTVVVGSVLPLDDEGFLVADGYGVPKGAVDLRKDIEAYVREELGTGAQYAENLLQDSNRAAQALANMEARKAADVYSEIYDRMLLEFLGEPGSSPAVEMLAGCTALKVDDEARLETLKDDIDHLKQVENLGSRGVSVSTKSLWKKQELVEEGLEIQSNIIKHLVSLIKGNSPELLPQG